MEYKLHRVAPNSDGWVRPSPGRLSSDGVGDYVKENSFGHEGRMPGHPKISPFREGPLMYSNSLRNGTLRLDIAA
jgi:hypothetical protein